MDITPFSRYNNVMQYGVNGDLIMILGCPTLYLLLGDDNSVGAPSQSTPLDSETPGLLAAKRREETTPITVPKLSRKYFFIPHEP